jgi:hypothetical protein
MSFSWSRAASALQKVVVEDAGKPCEEQLLDDGQRASLAWMAKRLPQSGVVLADEVGTGKTRIACAVVHAVLDAGGRAAVVVPHGLMHQWISESRKLRASSPAPKELTTLTEFFRKVPLKDATWKDVSPHTGGPEWWLISHGFRAPQVKSNSDVWRTALPAFVELHLASPAERKNRNTLIGKLQQEVENAPASWWGWNGMARIASEVAPRVCGCPGDLPKRIKNLPPLNVSSENNGALLAAFGDGGDGRPLTEELLGLWLGEFDIIVIDEAHKGRGEVDVEGPTCGAVSSTVLARLVEALLKQPKGGKRLCLTATPMELDLSQWLDLLARAHCYLDHDHGSLVIKRLHEAVRHAAIAPDEWSRLDELCAAARHFTKTLAPYVTRRRRDDDPRITSFRTRAALPDGLPHPHRRLQRVQIEWAETVGQNSPWLDVLFAAESMSQAALGLKKDIFERALQLTSATPSDEKKQKRLKHLIRDLYARIASGHLSADLFDTDVRIVALPDSDEGTQRKLQRTEYWRNKIQRAIGSNLYEDEHPRILAAVKEIESWTLQREKVLVFGVFLRPLRLLRDALNVRYSLRAADADRPIANSIHTDAPLLDIAGRQLERLRGEGELVGRLAKGNGADMRRALADSHKAYKGLRKKVRKRARETVIGWCNDASLFGRSPVDCKIKGALQDHLVSFVLDDFLATTSESDEVTPEHFDALTNEFVEERLRPLLGDFGDGDVDQEQMQAVLRQAALHALLEDDDGLKSFHARLLQGETRWETRRYLQAAFNRRESSPRVLIAQSQVGREGLNLDKSCRVVVQFHAEWNPAVLEQQIGRVDRKGSLWEQRAEKWLANDAQGEPPFVEVRQLIFEGTYDSFQWDRVTRRQHAFDASLFGSLLPPDAWDRVPEERKTELQEAAPSFRPPALK